MRNVTVRRSASGDASALARLASLDSASPPRGPALIAEADSRMLAALPLGSGRPIADPFEPTADLVSLLELRRAQIKRRRTRRGGHPGCARACARGSRTLAHKRSRGAPTPLIPRDRRRSAPLGPAPFAGMIDPRSTPAPSPLSPPFAYMSCTSAMEWTSARSRPRTGHPRPVLPSGRPTRGRFTDECACKAGRRRGCSDRRRHRRRGGAGQRATTSRAPHRLSGVPRSPRAVTHVPGEHPQPRTAISTGCRTPASHQAAACAHPPRPARVNAGVIVFLATTPARARRHEALPGPIVTVTGTLHAADGIGPRLRASPPRVSASWSAPCAQEPPTRTCTPRSTRAARSAPQLERRGSRR